MKVNEVRIQWQTESIATGVKGMFRLIGNINGSDVSTNWIDLGQDQREQLLINRMTQANGEVLRSAFTILLKAGDPEPVDTQPVVQTHKADDELMDKVREVAVNHSPKGAVNRLKEICSIIGVEETANV